METSQSRYRRLLDTLPDAVLVVRHGEIRYANRSAARLLGATSPRELLRTHYNDLVLSAFPLPGTDAEGQKLRRLDGQIIEVEAVAHINDHSRHLVLRDLSRLVATENALKRSEERFLMIAESVRDRAVITLDSLGCIAHWNEAAQRITGYTEEIVGHSLAALFGAEDEDALRLAIANGRSDQQGWRKRSDGTEYYAVTSVTALYDRDRQPNGFAVMLRDLTPGSPAEALQNEEQLRQAQRMEAVGRLASGIAHDFNNLLTAIQGHAQFMLEDLSDDDPSRRDAEEILHSAERAAALTRQLLAFTRGRAMQPQRMDLNVVVSSIERLLRRVITENITLTSALETDLWPVRGDRSQIEQILVNLVVNARDAMPGGGSITIKTANAELADSYAAKREDVDPGQYVMLAVSDTGVGMDMETQTHIFEPFFTTKEPGKGTGLGLSTVYGIVKQSGGHIFCYSEAGKGTTFKIYLPSADGHAHARSAKVRMTQQARSGETILIVEDDEAVLGLAKRVLRARGYEILTASTGAAAIDHIRKHGHRLSLLITDVVLPDTTGTSLVDLMRETLPGCCLLLMSGYTPEDVRRQGALQPGVEFIEKPFTPDGLAQKVRTILDATD